MIYILVSCASQRSQDRLCCATQSVFLCFQGTGQVVIYKDKVKRIQYAHHAGIDKLQLALNPVSCSPATRLLHNFNFDIAFCDDLSTAINLLEITPSRWSHAGLSTETLPSLGLNGELGLNLSNSATYCRCKIVSFCPDSTATIHLQARNVLKYYLLVINRATVCSSDDVKTTLASLHSLEGALDGISIFLLGTPSPEDSTPEDLNFVPADGNSQQAV
jgi:hypothetical protein